MKGKVVVLDGKDKYFVANEIKIENHQYYQIIKIDGDDDFVLVERIGDEFNQIIDTTLARRILFEMAKNI